VSDVVQLRELDEQVISIIKQNGYTTDIEILGILEAIKFDFLNKIATSEEE
jgi:hypothetical protein